MYGHGFAVDDNAFMLLDISDLQPAYYEVEVVPSVENVENANLADFKVGGHTLTPEFTEGELTYTLTTTDGIKYGAGGHPQQYCRTGIDIQ